MVSVLASQICHTCSKSSSMFVLLTDSLHVDVYLSARNISALSPRWSHTTCESGLSSSTELFSACAASRLLDHAFSSNVSPNQVKVSHSESRDQTYDSFI